MNTTRGEMIYEGKAKRIYRVVDQPQLLIHEFKNSLTANNGLKKGSFETKGSLNAQITSRIFSYLMKHKISSHWVSLIDENSILTHSLKMIPLEVVVRNRVAGSLAKRLGWEEGRVLPEPIVELYYKSDELGDPFINTDHARILGCATNEEVKQLKAMGLAVNVILREMWSSVDLDLIDFKMEFGKSPSGKIVLADEVSPDTSRLWDTRTQEKMDKDRFRRDLGGIEQAYQQVWQRLQTVDL